MPRKSLAKERTVQILEAFEQCIARYGLEGSTLERIAEQAEMKRTILRHYIGNREQLVEVVAERLLLRLDAQVHALSQVEAKVGSAEELLGAVVGIFDESSFQDVVIIEQFIASVELYPAVKSSLVEYIDAFTDTLSEKIVEWGGLEEKAWKVAYGVVCVLFNESSLVPLELKSAYSEAAEYSACILLDSARR